MQGKRGRRLCALFCALLVLTPRAAASGFRFALLSDTHVGTATGTEDLRLSVADLNERADISFVLLSGDITEFGSDAELREARAVLDSLRHPWRIIPGNHDTKWSESGCTSFPRIFGSDRFVMKWEGVMFVGLHQGPVMRMGDGHFAPEDIAWFDSVLTATPMSDPLVFVTHYPLDPAVDNWYEVTRRLRKRETLVILHGHGHTNRAAVQDGIPAVMARSNLRAKAERGGYTIVDIRGDSMVFVEKRTGLPELPPWHVLTVADRSDAADEPPAPLPDFSINALPGTPREAWSYACGATVTTGPAVAGDLAIVGDALGRVRALNVRSGRARWEYLAQGPVHSAPAVSADRVVFGSADGTIHCLETREGRQRWTLAARGPVLGAPAIVGGTVYIGASDGAFRAIDLSTGALRWEYTGLEGFVEARPLVAEGRVIFGAWDSHLYALDASNGTLVWKWSNGSASRGLSPAACWPVGANGKVFVVAPDRFITALDGATGRQLWRSNRFQVREAIGISSDGQTVFARTMRDTVVALRTDVDSLAVEWLAYAGFGYDIAPCMPVEDGGEVIVGTKNGLVIALDRKDGRVLWKRKIGVTVVATPVPVAGGLLLSDLDGKVSMLKRKTTDETRGTTRFVWTRYHGNPVFPATPGPWREAQTANPDLLLIDSTYHMYFRGQRDGHDRIGVATIPKGRFDGVTWNIKPGVIIDVGEPGSWDESHALDPAAVMFRGKVFLYYTGVSPRADRSVCLAVSDDGVRFTKYSQNPVIIGGAPEVVCRDSTLYLYFWKQVPGKKGFQIHYATSRDGYRYSEPGQSLALPVGPDGSWDSFTAETPRIFHEGGLYYMVYCGSDRNKDYPFDAGLATSRDLIRWTKYPGNPIFSRGEEGRWDEGAIWFTTVERIDGRYYMWYEGYGGGTARTQPYGSYLKGGKSQVGMATLDAPYFYVRPEDPQLLVK